MTMRKRNTNRLATLGVTLFFGLITSLSFAQGNNDTATPVQMQPTQPPQGQVVTMPLNTQTNVPTPPQIQPALENTATPQNSVNSTALNPNSVNINLASAAEIQDKLVGIGAKKAQAIVDYREKNGKFISLEQLTEVSGIGKATLDKNRDRIVLE